MYIDVIIPTWNSNAYYFPIVIQHIMNVLKPHHLIVIDRFSQDGTQEVLRKHAEKILKLIELDADLAYARKIGAFLADTEVVCYVDDDVIVPIYFKPLIERILSTLSASSRIGVIAFSTCSKLPQNKIDIKVSRVIRHLESLSCSEVLKRGLHIYSRGFTFFFCIKKKIMKSWNPPIYLSAYEDYHLTQHTLGEGYLWVELSIPCVIHVKDYRYRGLYRYIKQGLWEGANVLTSGIPPKYVILHVVGRLLGAIYNKKLHQFLTYIGYVIGVVMRRRFRIWKR